ncbi:MAG TPA: hypothetical protein VJ890_23365 [Vineibacter sp.]|nr:hypothetical protein [Vineibacter sp.]
MVALIMVVLGGAPSDYKAQVIPPHVVVGEFKTMEACVKAAKEARVVDSAQYSADLQAVGQATSRARLFCVRKSD